MSDAWYYADSGSARGPMPLVDLVTALSAMRSPADTLVWRAGFQSWTKVADVPEVAQRVLTPAPFLPPPIPVPAQAPPTPPAGEPDAVAEPPRIRGWLILLGICQVLGTIRLIEFLRQFYVMFVWEAEQLPAAFVAEASLFVAYSILVVATTVLFFRRSRLFPRFFVLEVIASIVYLPLNVLLVVVTAGAAGGQSPIEILVQSFDPKDAQIITGAAIFGGLWIWYLYASERAARTFVR